MGNPLVWPEILSGVSALVSEIRAERYQISLDVQGLLKSAIWPFLAAIPQRYGFDQTREQAALLYNQKRPPHELHNPDISAVSKYLEFAQALGCPPEYLEPAFVTPPVGEAASQNVSVLLSEFASPQPLVILAPATIWLSKHWTVAHWQTLIEQLKALPVNVGVIGSQSDQTLIQTLLKTSGQSVKNWCGRTSLTDLYALFAQSAVVVGPDSAPLHIANATQTPVVIGLFGPTGPKRTGPVLAPGGPIHQTLFTQLSCQPCFERVCPLSGDAHMACMRQLTPDSVLQAIQTALGARTGAVVSP